MYRFINETLRAFPVSMHLRAPRFCRLTVRCPSGWGRAVWSVPAPRAPVPQEQFSQTVQHSLEGPCLTWLTSRSFLDLTENSSHECAGHEIILAPTLPHPRFPDLLLSFNLFIDPPAFGSFAGLLPLWRFVHLYTFS